VATGTRGLFGSGNLTDGTNAKPDESRASFGYSDHHCGHSVWGAIQRSVSARGRTRDRLHRRSVHWFNSMVRPRLLSKSGLTMKIADVFQLLVCGFSVAAAFLWMRSATSKLPARDSRNWLGEGPFLDAVKMQSKWSGWAAACAAIAALFQALAFVLSWALN
jgi:hypothetical protein